MIARIVLPFSLGSAACESQFLESQIGRTLTIGNSGCRAFSFAFHPFLNEIRARDDAESSVFAAHQVIKRSPIQLLQARETKKRPQLAICGGLHELVQVRKMSLE
jgi:hypothetical protein